MTPNNFPPNGKLQKAIPLFKKGQRSLLDNSRPILILQVWDCFNKGLIDRLQKLQNKVARLIIAVKSLGWMTQSGGLN